MRAELRRSLEASAVILGRTTEVPAPLEVELEESAQSVDILDLQIEAQLGEAQRWLGRLRGARDGDDDDDACGSTPASETCREGTELGYSSYGEGQSCDSSPDVPKIMPISPARRESDQLATWLREARGHLLCGVSSALERHGLGRAWERWQRVMRAERSERMLQSSMVEQAKAHRDMLAEQQQRLQALMEQQVVGSVQATASKLAAAEALSVSLQAQVGDLEAELSRRQNDAKEATAAEKRALQLEEDRLRHDLRTSAETASQLHERLRTEESARDAAVERAALLEAQLVTETQKKADETQQKAHAVLHASTMEQQMAAVQEEADAARQALRQNSQLLTQMETQMEAQQSAKVSALVAEVKAAEARHAESSSELLATRRKLAETSEASERLRAELAEARQAAEARAAEARAAEGRAAEAREAEARAAAEAAAAAAMQMAREAEGAAETEAAVEAVGATSDITSDASAASADDTSASALRSPSACDASATVSADALAEPPTAPPSPDGELATQLREALLALVQLEARSHCVEACLRGELEEDDSDHRAGEREREATGAIKAALADALSELATQRTTAQQLRVELAAKNREVELLTTQLQSSILQGIERVRRG